jgi:hypothetical protein
LFSKRMTWHGLPVMRNEQIALTWYWLVRRPEVCAQVNEIRRTTFVRISGLRGC